LLRRSLARGRPTPMQLLLFVAFWLLPMNLRQRLRALSRQAGSVKRRQDLGAC